MVGKWKNEEVKSVAKKKLTCDRQLLFLNKRRLFLGAEWGGPALERLVRETRSKLRSSRRYWSQLPALLCTSASVTTTPCFNGTDVAP